VCETQSWNVKEMSLCISTDSQLRLTGSTIFTEVPVVFILLKLLATRTLGTKPWLEGYLSIESREFVSAVVEDICACGKDHFG